MNDINDEYLRRGDVLSALPQGVTAEVVPYNYLIDLIKRVPAADAEAVRRGAWEIHKTKNDYYGVCLFCGEDTSFRLNGEPFEYCPHCGAIMEAQ